MSKGSSIEVVYKHYRVDSRTGELRHIVHGKRFRKKWVPSEYGGETHCIIRDRKTRKWIGTGIARCSPKDRYESEVGRQISLDRARVALDVEELIS